MRDGSRGQVPLESPLPREVAVKLLALSRGEGVAIDDELVHLPEVHVVEQVVADAVVRIGLIACSGRPRCTLREVHPQTPLPSRAIIRSTLRPNVDGIEKRRIRREVVVEPKGLEPARVPVCGAKPCRLVCRPCTSEEEGVVRVSRR